MRRWSRGEKCLVDYFCMIFNGALYFSLVVVEES